MVADKPIRPEHSAIQALQQAGLSQLMERAEKLTTFDQKLRCCLPSILASHCHLANWDAHTLVFQVQNSIWKNKLRLHSMEILNHAQTLGLHAREIKIKINPAFQPIELTNDIVT